MSYSSKDETIISNSGLECVDRCYKQLWDDSSKVKFSEELFRWPYSPGKMKLVYPFKDLLQHATDIGKDCFNKDIKHKGKPLGLVKYMKNEIDQEDLALEFAGLNVEPSPGDRVNALFVWPWMGVLANADGESISKLKNVFLKRGFDPVRVRPLSDGGYAVVEFKRDWHGFYNAVMFEKEFEVDHRGKKDYLAASRLDSIYGWVARDDDYNAGGALGEYLQKNGDLKTIGDVESDVKHKTALLASHLSSIIQELSWQHHKIESNDYSKLQSANFPFAGSEKATKGPTFVVWDVSTCPLPHVEEDCEHIVSNICSANFSYSPCTKACSIKAYGAVETPLSISRILNNSMLLLHSNPESHVSKMICGMNQWAEWVPAPANLMVISCEKGLSSTLQNLHSRGYNILLVHPDGKSPPDLVAIASCVWRFSSLLRAGSQSPYRVRKDLIPRSFGLAASPSDGRYGLIARDECRGCLGVSTSRRIRGIERTIRTDGVRT